MRGRWLWVHRNVVLKLCVPEHPMTRGSPNLTNRLDGRVEASLISTNPGVMFRRVSGHDGSSSDGCVVSTVEVSSPYFPECPEKGTLRFDTREEEVEKKYQSRFHEEVTFHADGVVQSLDFCLFASLRCIDWP